MLVDHVRNPGAFHLRTNNLAKRGTLSKASFRGVFVAKINVGLLCIYFIVNDYANGSAEHEYAESGNRGISSVSMVSLLS
jgi:hypothetical protein